MKHAYLIMAHADFELLDSLLSMLDDARNDIYLHIDKKERGINPKGFHTFRAGLFVIDKRLDVRWGDASQIRLELLLFQTACNNGPYAYYHLLSGVDLPIQSQDDIHDFFERHQGKEFVGFWNDLDWQADKRVAHYFFFMRYERNKNRYLSIFFAKMRNLLEKLFLALSGERGRDRVFKKGPNWVSITHDFCGYLLSQKKWIRKRFRHTRNGDEIFLQTVLWNSPFKARLYDLSDTDNGCMREIDWKRGTATSPYVWRSDDFDYLRQSKKLFARKFSTKTDPRIIRMISNEYRS